MTTKSGKPRASELPETLKHSPAKAQRTFAKAHDSAVGGEGRSRMSKEELAEAIARAG